MAVGDALSVEAKIVGSCIGATDEILSVVFGRVKDDFFQDRINRFLFKTIKSIYGGGERRITVNLIVAKLSARQVKAIGGQKFLDALKTVGLKSAGEVSAIVDTLISKRAIQKKLDLFASLQKKLLEYDGSDISHILTAGERELYELSKEFSVSGVGVQAIRLGENLRSLLQAIENHDKRYQQVYTGWAQLDEKMPLMPGRLYSVGARTKAGKSSLALEICRNISLIGVQENNGVLPSAIFDTELIEDTENIRLLASVSGIDQRSIEKGKWAVDDKKMKEALYNTLQVIEERSKISWVSMLSPNLESVISEARALVRRDGIRLLIFDWLKADSLMGPGTKVSEWQAVGLFVFGLHGLAVELEIPIVMMCQVSKSGTDEAVRKAVKAGHADMSGLLAMSDRIFWGSDVVAILRKTLPGIDYNEGDEVVAWETIPNRLLSIVGNRHGEVHTATEGFELRHSGGTYRMQYLGERSEDAGCGNIYSEDDDEPNSRVSEDPFDAF